MNVQTYERNICHTCNRTSSHLHLEKRNKAPTQAQFPTRCQQNGQKITVRVLHRAIWLLLLLSNKTLLWSSKPSGVCSRSDSPRRRCRCTAPHATNGANSRVGVYTRRRRSKPPRSSSEHTEYSGLSSPSITHPKWTDEQTSICFCGQCTSVLEPDQPLQGRRCSNGSRSISKCFRSLGVRILLNMLLVLMVVSRLAAFAILPSRRITTLKCLQRRQRRQWVPSPHSGHPHDETPCTSRKNSSR